VKTDTRGTQVGNSSHQFIASQRAYMHYVGGVKCESINQNKMYFKGTENCKREIQRSVFVISHERSNRDSDTGLSVKPFCNTV